MTLVRTTREFDQAWDTADAWCWGAFGESLGSVTLGVGSPYDFTEPRAFAYCARVERGCTIVVAPDFDKQTITRRHALLFHEFGHAIEWRFGRSRVLNAIEREGYDLAVWGGTERRADALAEVVFGCRIGYDGADVQTLRGGVRPRPVRLGGS